MRKATSNLVLEGWLCPRCAVAMKLDFELDIARKAGCTVRLVAIVVRHMEVGLDFPLWV